MRGKVEPRCGNYLTQALGGSSGAPTTAASESPQAGCAVTFIHFVVIQSRPHGLQHSRPPCPSPSPASIFTTSFTISSLHPCPSPSPASIFTMLSLMSIKLVMPSNHLIFCHPLLLPSVFPSIKVFSSEQLRWPKYWSFSFSISLSSEYLELISFRMDWFDLLTVQGTLPSLLQQHSLKASVFWCLAFFMVHLLHSYVTAGFDQSFD